MATPAVTEDAEDDVEFVSEGPLRPVLECIDLLSDGEDDGGVLTIEDQVDRQKAQVVSTLDRLARQVAVEKHERAEKCKAFKEKVISQQAHGRQELAFSCSNGDHAAAKRCVDIWLKMPGVKPGVINNGTSWRRRSAPVPSMQVYPQTCPVINCRRVYDNPALLEGHLKRFDHSPCDPTVMLKGSQISIYACVACGKHFDTKEEWRLHLDTKVSSSSANGHSSSQTCQLIVCFACPACYLLFNHRDECLKHMAAKNHFTQSISLTDTKVSAAPIPIPRFAKNRLIALCKDVPFNVKCTTCSKVLASHMDAKAHFNVLCRQGCAIAEADQTVAQIMKQLGVVGNCSSCTKIFLNQGQVEKHEQQTQHEVEVISTMERAVLLYSNFSEIQSAQKAASTALSKHAIASKATARMSSTTKNCPVGSLAKRQRLSASSSQAESGSPMALAWFCECGLCFPEEDMASRHLLAANQIFHKCGVCGKLMGESSIARLHMSRFHGGAHLSNFLFHCRQCKVDMPRMEDILSHVGVTHRGHTYYQEREETMEKMPPNPSTKPSTSAEHYRPAGPSLAPPPKQVEKWLCRMCEDIFDSEDAVQKHCRDFGNHSFQRFACGHCPQKFFKESTLRRHCLNEHEGQIVVRYFCGLCDSMLYDSEQEFLEHYSSLHSKDFYCLEAEGSDSPAMAERPADLPNTSKGPEQLCICMAWEKSKQERKATYTRCMKQLASECKCSYVCRLCAMKTFSYSEIKTHVHLKHGSAEQKSFDVVCASCSMSHADVPSFHSHYHAQHCPLEPCISSGTSKADRKSLAAITKTLNAEEILPEENGKEYEGIENAVAASSDQMKEDPDSKTIVGESISNQDEFDEELKRALALSAEEAKQQTEFDIEMEEALKRSMQEF